MASARGFRVLALTVLGTLSCSEEKPTTPSPTPATAGTGATASPSGGTSSAGGAVTSGSMGGAAGTPTSSGASSIGGQGGETAGSPGGGGQSEAGAANAGAGGEDSGVDEPGPASLVGFDWGKAVIDTRLATTPTFGTKYQDGLALRGIALAYRRLHDPKYLAVLTQAADSYPAPTPDSLDNIMHMAAVVDAYELTGKQAYTAPAQAARQSFDSYPKADGVFWHANNGMRDHQLWADGTFMSLGFLTRYGAVFNDASVWPMAATQLVNTAKHLKNPATGLLWHAWDESGNVAWSKHPSKTNEIHWGRGMGWFAVASVLALEALPANDPGRAPVEQELKGLVEAVAKYQDPTTGRWYQVVDMPSDSRNWLETSCSAMFSYATWWAYKHRLVDASYAEVAKKGLAGVLQRTKKDASDRTILEETCTGLSASDDLVGNYFNHTRADNDPHGVGVFVLMWEGMQ